MNNRRKYDTGDIIEDVLVLRTFKNPKQHHARAVVKCLVCNREKEIQITCLARKSGTTHSACGKGIKYENEKFHRHWDNMRTRTTNINSENYKYYKDISSDDFKYFIDFYDYMFESYLEHVSKHGEKNTTLDRINPYKNYEKGNIRWATWEIQYTNKKIPIKKAISPENEVYYFTIISKFYKEHNIKMSTTNVKDYIEGKIDKNRTFGWHFELVGRESND